MDNICRENFDYVIKKSKNNGNLLIKEIDYDVAKKMVVKNHYSHTWNTSFGKINFGILQNFVKM